MNPQQNPQLIAFLLQHPEMLQQMQGGNVLGAGGPTGMPGQPQGGGLGTGPAVMPGPLPGGPALGQPPMPHPMAQMAPQSVQRPY